MKMKIKNSVSAVEDLMRERTKALTDRLGYVNAGWFIAIMGGEGDSVKDIREKRTQSDIDMITERIKRRRSAIHNFYMHQGEKDEK